MKRTYLFLAMAVLATGLKAQAAQPHAKANAAFDTYVAQLELQLEQQHRSVDSFVASSGSDRNSVEARLRRGDLILEKRAAGMKVPGGLIHHWRGTAFVPGATAADFLRIVQDADHFTSYYKPQVVRSKLVAHSGDLRQVSMRLRQHKVITVTLDTAYDVRYGALDAEHGYSISRSTQVSEIADADSAHEHALGASEDHGFMWRLNSYWTYAQRNDGLLLQLEAVSLTRDVPLGLDWAIGPFVFSIPKDSLEFTLNATRNALANRRHYGN